MKPLHFLGWLLAGLLAAQSAATAVAAPSNNPLEAHVLQHSGGVMYLYHNGMKFLVGPADLGDAVIDAIPNASAEQWNALFTTGPGDLPVGMPQRAPAGDWDSALRNQPQPFPGYS